MPRSAERERVAQAEQNMRMHGLVMSSTIPLHHGRLTDDQRVDVAITQGPDRPCPDGVPEGEQLATLARPDGGTFYTLVERPEHYLFRWHGECDIVINRELTAIECFPDPDCETGALPVILPGMIVSMLLCLRGELILHASAVDIDSRAVAFVGRSGMGKSTLATWLCSTGARLITDDVLRVQPANPTVCWLGATESRLRPAAATLVERFEGAARQTADERTAVSLPLATTEPTPVRCVLVPSPDREAKRASIEWLSVPDALIALSMFPRILGWESPRVLGEQFAKLGAFVKNVPVGIATVPWGPPFDPDVPAQLLQELRGV